MCSAMVTCPPGPSAAAHGPKCITPISIHRWPSNDVQNIEEIHSCFSRAPIECHTGKNNLAWFYHFWMITPFSIHRWLSNDAQSYKKCWQGVLLFIKVTCPVSRSHGPKYCLFGCSFIISGQYIQFEFTDSYEKVCVVSRSMKVGLCYCWNPYASFHARLQQSNSLRFNLFPHGQKENLARSDQRGLLGIGTNKEPILLIAQLGSGVLGTHMVMTSIIWWYVLYVRHHHEFSSSIKLPGFCRRHFRICFLEK